MDTPNESPKASGPSAGGEPVEPKQKAVLEFLKMPVPPTRAGASNLIKAVFEGPAGNSYQNLWDTAKYELHPDLYPPKPKKEIPPQDPPSVFSYAMKAIAVLAVLFYAMDWYREKGKNIPPEKPADVPAVTVPAPVVVPAPNTPAPSPVVSDILSLESIDGRMIKAKVLALTKETVLIRREDGETFDLPLDRLTPESKLRIDEYRAAKKAGRMK